MNLCPYHEHFKCTVCKYPYYRQCKNFLIARAKFLTKELQPFVYKSRIKVTDKVVQSNNENDAKSAALKFCMKFNSEVKKLTLNQVVSLTLSNSQIESKVIYIECKNRPQGDLEKLRGVVMSFIEGMSMQGTSVSVFVSLNVPLKLEYPKVTIND